MAQMRRSGHALCTIAGANDAFDRDPIGSGHSSPEVLIANLDPLRRMWQQVIRDSGGAATSQMDMTGHVETIS